MLIYDARWPAKIIKALIANKLHLMSESEQHSCEFVEFRLRSE